MLRQENGKLSSLDLELSETQKIILEQLRERSAWSLVEVQSLFICLRHLLEIRKLKNKYQVVNFYCNWAAHIALLVSSVGHQILEAFNGLFFELHTYSDAPKSDEEYKKRIKEILSIHQFAEQARNLLQEYNIPTLPILEDQNIPVLQDMIFTYLHGKSIAYGDNENDANRYYKDIHALYVDKKVEHLFITQVALIKMQGTYCLEIKMKGLPILLLTGYLN